MSLVPTLLLSLALAPIGPQRAEISGERYHGLIDEPEPPHVEAWAQRRTLKVKVEKDGLVVRGRWTIRAAKPSWFAGGLFKAGVHIRRARWNGAPAGLWEGSEGTMVVGRVGAKPAVLEVEAFVPGASTRELALMGATEGEVELVSDEPLRVVTDGMPVLRDGTRFTTSAAVFRLERPPEGAADERTIAMGQIGIGLTVGDDALRGQAHLRYVVRKGKLERLALDIAQLGEDLELEGVNVESWKRDGNRVDVVLRKPAESTVDLTLKWSRALAKTTESKVALPVIEPRNVFRSESTLQLARDGEVDAVPEVGGWSAVASAALPAWGKGLVEGSPTAAYRRAGAGYKGKAKLDLYRFEAVAGPPMVVEIADLLMATSAEGRRLIRARYEVRNERAPFLEVRPPPGMKPIGAWVLGEAVRAAPVDGAWRIALPRSIETLDGLITFPVVVAFFGDETKWKRREKRELALPTVSAPVNVNRVTLHLPLEYRSLLDPGDGPVVEYFTKGNEVAFGLTDVKEQSKADAAYRRAYDYWNDNEFEAAQRELERLDKMGAKGKNQEGLRANVDAVVLPAPPPAKPAEDALDAAPGVYVRHASRGITVMERQRLRRIKSKARARSGKKKAKQRDRKKKAKKLKEEGRYEEAAAEYEKALEETRELKQLEDEESAEYDFEEDEIQSEIKDTRSKSEARSRLEQRKKFIADEDEYPNVLVPEPEPSGPVGPPIVVPTAGVPVRYQFLLLEPGARRSVPVDARTTRRKG